MKRIFWVLGEQQAGKTTFARFLSGYGADVLMIGEEIRKIHDPMKFVDETNAYAAPSVEQMVQEMIVRKLDEFKTSDRDLLVIDSAPKNMNQYEFVLSVVDISTIVVVREQKSVRLLRAKVKYKDDMKLFEAREPEEQRWLEIITKICSLAEIPLLMLDNRNRGQYADHT